MEKRILIVLGSASDSEYLGKCIEFLKQMEVPYTLKVASAHRSPDRVHKIIEEFGPKCSLAIAFAGHAAHLAGVLASKLTIPVVAVPLPSSDLKGQDALLATVQMPGGVPVASMAIGNAGSQNAAVFATQVLAISDPALAERLSRYKQSLAEKTENSSKAVEEKWGQ